jgi:hypothetical protein
MHDEMDPGLRLLFEEQNGMLAEEPFLSNTLHRLKRRQVQQDFLHKILFVLALACCALLSSFFIRGSILLSEYVSIGLRYFEGLLEMPIVSILCGVLLIILTRRKLIFALVRP